MSARQRGQETQVLFNIDGTPKKGSWLKVTDWSLKPRTEILEDDFVGETESDLDIMHHGHDWSFSIQNEDVEAIDYMTDVIFREQQRKAHPKITMTVLLNYRKPGATNAALVCHQVFLKVDELGAPGRKERTKTVFSGKFKKLDKINQ